MKNYFASKNFRSFMILREIYLRYISHVHTSPLGSGGPSLGLKYRRRAIFVEVRERCKVLHKTIADTGSDSNVRCSNNSL